jgi:uncharacterized membrane protein
MEEHVMSIKSVSIRSFAFAAAIATLPVLALGAFTPSSAFAQGQGGNGGSGGGGSGDGGSASDRSYTRVPNNSNKRPTVDEDRGCFTLIDNRRTGRVVRGFCIPLQ